MASSIIDANIELHTRLAETYDREEPQFRPENTARVRALLHSLRNRSPGGRLLDIGCGTGFIISLARGLFDDIHGLDVTQAMLDRVDRSSGNVTLHNAPAERLPFADCSFDTVTAYSFLHHAEDCTPIILEVARVLKTGGIFYVDQEPNREFWRVIEGLQESEVGKLLPIVAKARDAVLETDAKIEREHGVNRETFRLAEYGKAVLGGFDAADFARTAALSGFATCEIRREWFLGQADFMREQSIEAAEHMADLLRRISPLSDHLFKYLQFVLCKDKP